MKKKTETILAIDHSKRVCDSLPDSIDRLEVSMLVMNAYRAGYNACKKWMQTLTDWNDCIPLAQCLLIKMAKEGINMNAAELVLSILMNHNDSRYRARLSVQYSKEGEKTLEEKAYELVDKMLSNGSGNCDIREELKKAVLAGYNLHHEDFDA